jgi:hypothetical protein
LYKLLSYNKNKRLICKTVKGSPVPTGWKKVVWPRICRPFLLFCPGVFSLFLLLTNYFAFSAEAAILDISPDQGIQITVHEGTKVSRFKETGEYVWCGENHLAISRHSLPCLGGDAGIRLLNIEDGSVDQLTANCAHRVVACTSDGKHIFFVDHKNRGSMFVFDIAQREQQQIYSNNVGNHTFIENYPISPSGDILIGPTTLKGPVVLSDRSVNVVHVPDAFAERYVPSVTWSGNGSVFIIIGSVIGGNKNNPQQVIVQRYGDNDSKIFNLPNIPTADFYQSGWSDRTKRLYLLSWREAADLYEIDPESPADSLRMIAPDVDQFKVASNGILAYEQHLVDENISTGTYGSMRILVLRTAQGKLTELFKVPYHFVGIMDLQISPEGKKLAIWVKKLFGRESESDSTEILIFHSIDAFQQ